MNKVVKGSFELMKKLNVEAILKVIKEYGRLSRADIAKLTGLTPASVTNITKILIESDYLIERGIGESSGGRPPILLEINIKARYVIGVSIGVGNIEVALTDLGANIRLKKSLYIDERNTDEENVFIHLINLINEVLEISEVDRRKIAGIGVAMHGIVNPILGISQYAPYYKWKRKGLETLKNMRDVLLVCEELSMVPCQKKAWENKQYSSGRLNIEDRRVVLLETLARILLEEMKARNLVSGTDVFLESYLGQVLKEITL